MKTNLHTHTYRCGHASGSAEEYIIRAIENGITVLGFSEHVPFLFPNGEENLTHLQLKDVKDYFTELRLLREKYKDKINIHIGYEMEYFPQYFKEMYSMAKEQGAEYLLLGQHRVGNEYPCGHWIGMVRRPVEDLVEYVDYSIAGMKTGVFTYLCHPDIIDATDDMERYIAEMTRLCMAAKEYDMPLEINFFGIRDNRFYPFEEFWKIAGSIGCKAVFGFDAHDILAAYDGDSIPVAERIVSKYGLELVRDPQIVTLP